MCCWIKLSECSAALIHKRMLLTHDRLLTHAYSWLMRPVGNIYWSFNQSQRVRIPQCISPCSGNSIDNRPFSLHVRTVYAVPLSAVQSFLILALTSPCNCDRAFPGGDISRIRTQLFHDRYDSSTSDQEPHVLPLSHCSIWISLLIAYKSKKKFFFKGNKNLFCSDES